MDGDDVGVRFAVRCLRTGGLARQDSYGGS